MPPQLIASSDAPTSVSCDALVVAATSSSNGIVLGGVGRAVDEALDGFLMEHLSSLRYKAKVGEVVLVPTMQRIPAKNVAIVGLGSREQGNQDVRKAAGAASRRLADHAVVASGLHDGMGERAAGAAAEGFLLGSYRFTRYRSEPQPSLIERIVLLGEPPQAELERAAYFAEATALARDLTNEPAVTLTPEALAARAREVAEAGDLECTIFEPDELERRGFGGILGVARGSAEPPRFIQLRYSPEGGSGKVALVGKGITFDSGGLSLKDAKNMEAMKTDMAGSAAVIAAMSVLSRLSIGVEVVAYVPATENMPGERAIKPGDVITHYGGRTSEVLNTDAEGRLVLADAVAYASEQGTDAIVDVATLTGAIMVALGRKATGLFATDDDLAHEIEQAAQDAGERVWRMPLYDDYRSELDSEIADIKNIGSRYGGAIFGALFVKEFVGKNIPWAHLDIAGPARAESDYDEVIRGGSGVATRTLLTWLEGRSG